MREKMSVLINNFIYPLLVLICASTVAFLANFFFIEYPKAIARIDMNTTEIINNRNDILEQKGQIIDELKEIRQTQRDIINILMKKGMEK